MANLAYCSTQWDRDAHTRAQRYDLGSFVFLRSCTESVFKEGGEFLTLLSRGPPPPTRRFRRARPPPST
jgi:hypothetical protein